MSNLPPHSHPYLPPLSTLVPDASTESAQLPMITAPAVPMEPSVRRALNVKLPSVDKILENISNAAIAQHNMHMQQYGASNMRPIFDQPHYEPKAIPLAPVAGPRHRPPHIRSISLSNFQLASTISDRSRSYSFSYTPVRFLQSEEVARATEIHRGILNRASSPRKGVGKKRGRKKKADVKCGQCLLENTPEWRRGPNGSRTLCNACGLFYLKLTKKFGYEDANIIFAYKKKHNEVLDRIVPTTVQRDRFVLEQRDFN